MGFERSEVISSARVMGVPRAEPIEINKKYKKVSF